MIDPASILAQFRAIITTDGTVCLGFEHTTNNILLKDTPDYSDDTQNLEDKLTRLFTLPQARAMLLAAGFTTEKIFRVFRPGLSRAEALLAQKKQVTFAGIPLHGLSHAELEDVFCLRFFVFASPNPGFSVPHT